MKKSMVKVNFVEGKIEMTPAFAEAAGKVGSAEYKQLVETQANFPGYGIEVVTPKKKASRKFKGMDFAYMEKFIRDRNDTDTLREFATLRGMMVSENGELVEDPSKAVKAVATIGQMQSWFLEVYHEDFEDYDKELKAIMCKTKAAKAKRLAA